MHLLASSPSLDGHALRYGLPDILKEHRHTFSSFSCPRQVLRFDLPWRRALLKPRSSDCIKVSSSAIICVILGDKAKAQLLSSPRTKRKRFKMAGIDVG